jgi:hypothetical protein
LSEQQDEDHPVSKMDEKFYDLDDDFIDDEDVKEQEKQMLDSELYSQSQTMSLVMAKKHIIREEGKDIRMLGVDDAEDEEQQEEAEG